MPDMHVFECGCVINHSVDDGGRNVMNFTPCRPSCIVLKMVLAMAQEQGKPIEHREMP